MTASCGKFLQAQMLPLSLGISDGILNALTLAGSRVIHGLGLDVGLALRVGTAALVTAVFTMFVAEYAQLRLDLARAEHQLNVVRTGTLAHTDLGRRVRIAAATAAVVAGAASFLGAFAPLVLGAVFSSVPFLAVAASVLALAGLGALLARSVHARPTVWAVGLGIAGIMVTIVGVQLDLV